MFMSVQAPRYLYQATNQNVGNYAKAVDLVHSSPLASRYVDVCSLKYRTHEP